MEVVVVVVYHNNNKNNNNNINNNNNNNNCLFKIKSPLYVDISLAFPFPAG